MGQQAQSTSQRMLARAVRIAGGTEELARFLHLRHEDICSWISGTRTLPHRVFIALLDLILANRLVVEAARVLRREPRQDWHGPERRRPLDHLAPDS